MIPANDSREASWRVPRCSGLPFRRMVVTSSLRALRMARWSWSWLAHAQVVPVPQLRWKMAFRTCCSSTFQRWMTSNRWETEFYIRHYNMAMIIYVEKVWNGLFQDMICSPHTFLCCMCSGAGWSGWNQHEGVFRTGEKFKRQIAFEPSLFCWSAEPKHIHRGRPRPLTSGHPIIMIFWPL